MIVKFANGEQHECEICIPLTNELQIVLTDVSFSEAASIFSDPEKTREIVSPVYICTGYTRIKTMYPDPSGGICCELLGGIYELRNT